MSDVAETYVWEHSPYRGVQRLLHLRMAKLANDAHDWQLWCGEQYLAGFVGCDRKTVQRAKATMVKDGYLEDLHERHENGNLLYRFLMPSGDQSDISSPPSSEPKRHFVPTKATFRPDQSDISSPPPYYQSESDQEVTEKSRFSAETEELCDYLARGIAHHRGVRPKTSSAWSRHMDLLLRRGPLDWAKPAAVPEDEVRCVIRGLFTRLTVQSSSGFCWADQIRSPGNLRQHWSEIVLALQERPKKTSGGRQDTSLLWRDVQEGFDGTA